MNKRKTKKLDKKRAEKFLTTSCFIPPTKREGGLTYCHGFIKSDYKPSGRMVNIKLK